MEYLCPPAEIPKFNHCYLDLKFDFTEEEVKMMARTVQRMCRTDEKAFCLLTNYLIRGCLNVEKKGIDVR